MKGMRLRVMMRPHRSGRVRRSRRWIRQLRAYTHWASVPGWVSERMRLLGWHEKSLCCSGVASGELDVDVARMCPNYSQRH